MTTAELMRLADRYATLRRYTENEVACNIARENLLKALVEEAHGVLDLLIPDVVKLVGESGRFHYTIRAIDEFMDWFTYDHGDEMSRRWGGQSFRRCGLLLTISCEGENREFYMAGKTDRARIDDHMHSLTDELLDQWFKKKKTKEEMKAEKLAKKNEHSVVNTL